MNRFNVLLLWVSLMMPYAIFEPMASACGGGGGHTHHYCWPVFTMCKHCLNELSVSLWNITLVSYKWDICIPYPCISHHQCNWKRLGKVESADVSHIRGDQIIPLTSKLSCGLLYKNLGYIKTLCSIWKLDNSFVKIEFYYKVIIIFVEKLLEWPIVSLSKLFRFRNLLTDGGWQCW